MASSDDELLAGIREHDAAAFEALAARFRERLRRHLTGITRETDSAEDLLQELCCVSGREPISGMGAAQ